MMRWHHMAEAVMASNDASRRWLLEQIEVERRRTDAASNQRHAHRDVTVDDAVAKRQQAAQHPAR